MAPKRTGVAAQGKRDTKRSTEIEKKDEICGLVNRKKGTSWC